LAACSTSGFKRWLPLLGVGFTLLFCCLVSLAAGLMIFGELNLVTIGFCAILIGLGIDFGILVFGRYQQARDDGSDHAQAISDAIQSLGTAVFFGALTTAVGLPRVAPEQLRGIYAARRPDRDRHLPRRPLYDVGVLPLPAGEKRPAEA
jgi:uncharacterized membrane protein YdfJ with MMPL/SSD domain